MKNNIWLIGIIICGIAGWIAGHFGIGAIMAVVVGELGIAIALRSP